MDMQEANRPTLKPATQDPVLPPLSISLTFAPERVADLIIEALDGYAREWLGLIGQVEPTSWDFAREPGARSDCDYPLNPGGVLLFVHTESDEREELRLDYTALQCGLQAMAEKAPWHLSDFLQERDDADTGNDFLQLCFFGEIIHR